MGPVMSAVQICKKALLEWMRISRLSPYALASTAGVSEVVVRDVMAGKTVSLPVAQMLASALSRPVDTLMVGYTRPSNSSATRTRASKQPGMTVDDTAVVAMYKATKHVGLTFKEVGSRFGLSFNQVRGILGRAGVQCRRSKQTARAKLLSAEIVRRYQEGETAAKIGVALDLDRGTVYRTLASHGIQRRPAASIPGSARPKPPSLCLTMKFEDA